MRYCFRVQNFSACFSVIWCILRTLETSRWVIHSHGERPWDFMYCLKCSQMFWWMTERINNSGRGIYLLIYLVLNHITVYMKKFPLRNQSVSMQLQLLIKTCKELCHYFKITKMLISLSFVFSNSTSKS